MAEILSMACTCRKAFCGSSPQCRPSKMLSITPVHSSIHSFIGAQLVFANVSALCPHALHFIGYLNTAPIIVYINRPFLQAKVWSVVVTRSVRCKVRVGLLRNSDCPNLLIGFQSLEYGYLLVFLWAIFCSYLWMRTGLFCASLSWAVSGLLSCAIGSNVMGSYTCFGSKKASFCNLQDIRQKRAGRCSYPDACELSAMCARLLKELWKAHEPKKESSNCCCITFLAKLISICKSYSASVFFGNI